MSKPWRSCVLLVLSLLGGCHAVNEREREAAAFTGGDPSRAVAHMRRYGCAGCHTIPGVAGATGKVGPSLAGIAGRSYVAGVLTNDAEQLVRWIVNPKAIDPRTAMPVTGVSEGQARDIAAYLYTLR